MKKLLYLPFIALIRFYQLFISPILGPNKCRFNPTCSQYMIQSIQKKGLIKGIYFGCIRILKCNPFFEGGNDEVK